MPLIDIMAARFVIDSPISAETWDLVGSLFDRLADLPPGRRDLDALNTPPALRKLLQHMLIAYDSTDPQLLDQTVRAVANGLFGDGDHADVIDYAGREFGPWRAREEVGRGGMAVVLRGERADGRFEKEVAIKLLPHANAGIEHQRLLEEIRILARLEHPNIARLIDGGVGRDGTPYLVMEFVRGLPIDAYCDGHGLDIAGRIGLLIQVADAVLLAHRHLIVHCDIKPGNILVTEDGQVKLVDFGIAALIAGGADMAPRGLLCSPGYCAPEQMQGAAPDTAQDVYSLGAVLYELLCKQRIRSNSTATRMIFGAFISTDTPPPPSALQPGVDHDLDVICLKALAVDPGERYAGVEALQADLKHWQRDEPVQARGGGAGYRSKKWLRRHWLPATLAGLAALALLVGTGVAVWQAHQARIQAATAIENSQRANAVRDFLIELFEVSDPDVSAGHIPDTRELLNAGARLARDAFPDEPLTQAELLYTLARVHRKLGEPELGESLLAQARSVVGEKNSELHWQISLERVANAIDAADYEGASQLLNEVEMRYGTDSDPEVRTRMDIARLQILMRTRDNLYEAVDLGAEILDRPLEDIGGMPLVILAHSTVLGVYITAEELDAARSVGQRALDLLETGHATPSRRLAIYNNLASVERRLGHIENAIALRTRALDLARDIFSAPHFQQAYLAGNLGGDLVVAGRLGEGRKVLEEAAAMFEQLYPTANQRSIAVDNNLGLLLISQGEAEAALPYLERSLDVMLRELGAEHPRTLTARANRASAWSRLGRSRAAEGELLEVLAIRQRLHGEHNPSTLLSHEGLAHHYVRAGDPAAALVHADAALAGWRAISDGVHPRAITNTGLRAQALAMLGQTGKAQTTFEEMRSMAAESAGGVNLNYLLVLDYYSAFLVEHDPGRARQLIGRMLADPLPQGSEQRPEWQRINERYQRLQE